MSAKSLQTTSKLVTSIIHRARDWFDFLTFQKQNHPPLKKKKKNPSFRFQTSQKVMLVFVSMESRASHEEAIDLIDWRSPRDWDTGRGNGPRGGVWVWVGGDDEMTCQRRDQKDRRQERNV